MINQWIETQTDQKIVEMLKPGIVDPETLLVLANAIYFKGVWKYQFDPEETQEAPFNVSTQETPNVPLMFQYGTFKYSENARWQIVELPYRGGDIAMDILLPVDNDELKSGLKASELQQLLAGMSLTNVEVYLPRFKIEYEVSLKDTLQSMGMQDAFDDGKADFSGIAEGGLCISQAIHKAFGEVNEEGTEAAAATVVTYIRSGPPVFQADHPFLFLIRDLRSGSILFMGRVADPR